MSSPVELPIYPDLPEARTWESVQTGRPGASLHCLLDDQKVHGVIRTFFASVEEVVAIEYDQDGTPDVYDIYLDSNRPVNAQLIWLRTHPTEPDSTPIAPGRMKFPSLELAKMALELIHFYD